MAKQYKPDSSNSWGFSYDFATAKPMDTRAVVDTYTSLLSADTWKKGSEYMHYKGMKVSCADTGKVYTYIGETGNSTDVTYDSNWKTSELSASGPSNEYTLGKFMSFETTSELTVYTETIKAGTYVYVEERGEYYKVVQNSSGIEVANELNQGHAEALPDGYSAQGNYVIADKYKDVIYYCTDSEGEHRGKIYLNGLPYGGEDLKVASPTALGGIKVESYGTKPSNDVEFPVVVDLQNKAKARIPKASTTKDGLMTKEQVERLANSADKTELAKEVIDRENAINELDNAIQPRLQKVEGYHYSVPSMLGYDVPNAILPITEENGRFVIFDEYGALQFTEGTIVTPKDSTTIMLVPSKDIAELSNVKFKHVDEEGSEIFSVEYNITDVSALTKDSRYVFNINNSNTELNYISLAVLREQLSQSVNDAVTAFGNKLKEVEDIQGVDSQSLNPDREMSEGDIYRQDGKLYRKQQSGDVQTSFVEEFMKLRYDSLQGNTEEITIDIRCSSNSGDLTGCVVKIINKTSNDELFSYTITEEDLGSVKYAYTLTTQIQKGILIEVSVSQLSASWVTPASKIYTTAMNQRALSFLYQIFSEGFKIHACGLEFKGKKPIGKDYDIDGWNTENNQLIECLIYTYMDGSTPRKIIFGGDSNDVLPKKVWCPYYTDSEGTTHYAQAITYSDAAYGATNTKNIVDSINALIDSAKTENYDLLPSVSEDALNGENIYEYYRNNNCAAIARSKRIKYTDENGDVHFYRGYLPSLNEMKLFYANSSPSDTTLLKSYNSLCTIIGWQQWAYKEGKANGNHLHWAAIMTLACSTDANKTSAWCYLDSNGSAGMSSGSSCIWANIQSPNLHTNCYVYKHTSQRITVLYSFEDEI